MILTNFGFGSSGGSGGSGSSSSEICLFTQTTVVTVSNTTNELPITDGGVGSLLIPAGTLSSGSTLKLTVLGNHSAAANPTINIKIKLNSTVVLTTGAVIGGNSTNALFEIRSFITCYTPGSSGSFWAQGKYQEDGGGANSFQMVNTSAITINTLVDQNLSVTAQWGTASNSNIFRCTNLMLEKLSP